MRHSLGPPCPARAINCAQGLGSSWPWMWSVSRTPRGSLAANSGSAGTPAAASSPRSAWRRSVGGCGRCRRSASTGRLPGRSACPWTATCATARRVRKLDRVYLQVNRARLRCGPSRAAPSGRPLTGHCHQPETVNL
jgi:hypothetical protein